MKCHVLIDFDGTIAPRDTTDLLLDRFADPAWQDIEEEWKAGRIGSRECMVRQIDLVRATPRAYDAFVSDIEIDPNFPAFVDRCEAQGFHVSVVSDGLDRTIRTVLGRAGLGHLEVRANRLEWLRPDRWRLAFPHARSDCSALSGNCKCQFAEADKRSLRILIGDGRSDFCVAGRVDLVLAKSRLVEHCRENRIPHLPFVNFAEAGGLLAGWFENRAGADGGATTP
jgi:2,3-diketo-5-methylthio-1-phosphopentane phosphatase